MSRIIVKNLPKTITEEKLRQIFSQKGLLTDVQLKYAPNGKFRQFAFVGYQNETDAHEAIKYFNNTCIQTNKIEVTPCVLLGDSSKPKSWSKYALDNNGSKKSEAKDKTDGGIKTNTSNEVKDKTDQLLDKYKDDPLFEEFMEAHGVKTNSEQLSAGKNEIDKDDSGVSDGESSAKEEAEKPDEVTDLEYMQMLMKGTQGKPRQKMQKKVKEKINLYTLKLRNLPYKCKKKDIKHFFSPNIPFSIRIPRNVKGIAYVGFKNEKQLNKALLKNKSIISGKSIQVMIYKASDGIEEETDVNNQKKAKWQSQEEKIKNEETIAESGRIFIRNLAYTTTEDNIQELFSKFGPLAEVNLPIDTTTRKFKGFGIVTFVMPEHAVKAYTELDGSILQGRMLHLLPGMAKDSGPGLEDDDSTNYKRKKEKKQKSEAALSHNWNSLFLGQDAVAEIIADTYGTTKKAVLDPYGDSNTAVRLALGETQIIANTRKYLEQEGVVLDAFDKPTVRRSKTIILVKNLPANTKTKELHEIFKPHGVIGRIILPPNAVTAIVEFIEPSEARKAFTRLAYSKFKNLPLYLEWAPENSLSVKNETVHNKDNVDEVAETKSDLPSTELNQEELDNDESETPEPDTTLFVKNLNFETTDNVLKKHFESCGKVYYATVATKKDKNDPSKRLSMGYGFVQFMYKSGINKALKMLQQSDLDGKSLELKRSERTLAAFGEIKALRLPKKMAVGANSHRGFAFVDFVTASDAKKAFEALSQSTHLYGRRLVLEWATTDEGVDQIRKRTADHFHSSTEDTKSKKSVFNIE
ncbi:rna binding protein [Holotrichia oblita]|uniref:Rna binding protein n=1 Tax=Holotrichia oblita TaxID=644536 RepID=A0ACB9TTJ8_HOLOL|nr:rna binding protein [Holotrichia oblita]